MMLQIPMSKKAIAEAIGVDKSTVYREIKRNCDARSGDYAVSESGLQILRDREFDWGDE